MEARDLLFGDNDYENQIPSFESVGDAAKYLNECFIRGTFIEVSPNHVGYDLLIEAYHELLKSHEKDVEAIHNITSWGFECGLNVF